VCVLWGVLWVIVGWFLFCLRVLGFLVFCGRGGGALTCLLGFRLGGVGGCVGGWGSGHGWLVLLGRVRGVGWWFRGLFCWGSGWFVFRCSGVLVRLVRRLVWWACLGSGGLGFFGGRVCPVRFSVLTGGFWGLGVPWRVSARFMLGGGVCVLVFVGRRRGCVSCLCVLLVGSGWWCVARVLPGGMDSGRAFLANWSGSISRFIGVICRQCICCVSLAAPVVR